MLLCQLRPSAIEGGKRFLVVVVEGFEHRQKPVVHRRVLQPGLVDGADLDDLPDVLRFLYKGIIINHNKNRANLLILDTKCGVEGNGLFIVLKTKVFCRELDSVGRLIGFHINL